MKIIRLVNKNNLQIINQAKKILDNDGLVIAPSDTVYGLLADSTSKKTIDKLIKFKSRPVGKPISVFIGDLKNARKYVFMNKDQKKILLNLLPGPYTVILPSKHKVDIRLESEKETLGIRFPNYDFINQLVLKYQKPLTATSANLSFSPPHYSIKTLLNRLSAKKKKLIDLIIDAGNLPRNKPSTVIDYSQEKIRILRKGDYHLKNQLITTNWQQTYDFGKDLINQFIKTKKNKPLVILVEGEMGVGKTIFIKGIGNALGINNIISPTFVIYYEYDIIPNRHYSTLLGNLKKFYHFDLFRIETNKELFDLPFDKITSKKSIIAIEWGEKIGKIIDLFQQKANTIFIKMEYVNENSRKIFITHKG